MEKTAAILANIDQFVWGPVMLALMLGTGIYLMLKMRFLPLRNLGYALGCLLKRETGKEKKGEISPLASLTTELAATIGTGNIVGVATAMVLGGAGALVWMLLAAFIGFSTKFAESMLSVKYRVQMQNKTIAGGPMYTLKNAFPLKKLGSVLAVLFALFAVFASFGMGNMAQSNSITTALVETFNIPQAKSGLVLSILTILVILGGIQAISKITLYMVPCMALFYIIAAVTVIVVHIEHLPQGLLEIITMAFSPKAAVGGIGGAIVVSMQDAVRYGVSRGVFSNEAGLGAAGISAAAAESASPVRQGYISMTGVFFDTIIICTLTGLAIAASGVLGQKEGCFVSIGISLFAFATIIAWEYQGERAFEFLTGRPKFNICYRFVYSLVTFIGAVCALDIVWDFSDIMNAMMAIPNLICVLALSGEVSKDIKEYQYSIHHK